MALQRMPEPLVPATVAGKEAAADATKAIKDNLLLPH